MHDRAAERDEPPIGMNSRDKRQGTPPRPVVRRRSYGRQSFGDLPSPGCKPRFAEALPSLI